MSLDQIIDHYFSGDQGGLSDSDVTNVVELADCFTDRVQDPISRAMETLGLNTRYLEGLGEK
jgi:hypothetical protein